MENNLIETEREQFAAASTVEKEILARLDKLTDILNLKIIQTKNILSFAEAVLYLDMSESHIYKLTAKRKIPHYKQGKLIYFLREDLEAWLTANRVRTSDELQLEAIATVRRMGRK
ncbi:MAG: helix-turn-helix domain-containing protein [Bacteroidia bacterium]|nr:helix-turn-helix domain-containing protein [Bacteroidia bacterium]